MLTRRECLKLPILGFLGTLPLPFWAETAPKRRALVIGINTYEPTTGNPKEPEPDQAKEAHASASAVAKKTRQFGNLDGAINDAILFSQLLKDRLGFLPEDIVFLKDEQATREAILRNFREHLITAAAPGDISLFYYAGHGSQVRNLGSDEADQMDETLVPADSRTGVPDIRDKEMARLFRAALLKGVSLTVILDSCHSGGMSRGVWNGIGKTRELPPDPHTVNDPPDRDPVTGKKLPDATTMGMLFLAAARKDQPAGEAAVVERDSNGVEKEIAHGAFTVALAKVLATPAADQSVEQICKRVQALLDSQGKVQLPICGGANRETRGLLGQPAGLGTSITLAVTGVTDKSVRLQGGAALGLAPGCTLVRTNGSAIRLQLAKVELASSEANPLDGAAASAVHPGDLFKLQTWVVPPDTAIKLYFPKDGPAPAAVHEFAQAILLASRQMNIEILPEVSSTSVPTHVLYWKDGSYHLERFPAVAAAVRLGPSPGVQDLAKAFAGSGNARLWPILPPDRDLLSQLRLGAGTQNPAVQIVERPEDCVYLLAGRPVEGSIEYSWMFKDAAIVDPNQVHLPLRTDWKTTGAQLTELAVRLARIYAWLNFGGPAGGGDESFPYRLAFLKTGAKEAAVRGPFRFGEKYKIVFEASPEDLKKASEARGVSKRYVYVFLIDSAGEAQCLFPDPANGNENNRLPRSDTPSSRIEATGSEYDLEISEPAGTDNYFMVASEQPLDPAVFQWSGVRKPVGTRGLANSLDVLFGSVGEGTRGAQKAPSVPVNWSIESMAIRSMP